MTEKGPDLINALSSSQTLSFCFPPCGKIPPPVIMVQNVSFKYTEDAVSARVGSGGRGALYKVTSAGWESLLR